MVVGSAKIPKGVMNQKWLRNTASEGYGLPLNSQINCPLLGYTIKKGKDTMNKIFCHCKLI